MLVAAVDCATLTLSCALAEVGEGEVTLLADRTERAEPSGRGGHSARLPGALVELLGLLERRLPDVEGYAVGLGPGSFTGLRIGLATWKGLAYANRRPIAGVSSLAAMALDAAGAAPAGAVLVPLLDARKGEVYCGFYRAAGGRVEPIEPEAALGPVALLERVASLRRGGAEVLGFGEGFGAYRDVLAGPLAPLERLGSGFVSLPARGEASALMPLSRLPGAGGEALLPEDALALDNRRVFAAGRAGMLRVLLREDGAPSPLRLALEAGGAASGFDVRAVDAAALAAQAGDADVIVIGDVARPGPAELQAVLDFWRGGGALLLVPGLRADGVAWNELLLGELGAGELGPGETAPANAAWRLVRRAAGHPVLEGFPARPGEPLSSASFGLVRAYRPGSGRVLLEYDRAHPALIEAPHALVLNATLDLAHGDFAVSGAFLPLIHQCVRVLGRGTAAASLAPGDVWRAPAATGEWRVVDETGRDVPVALGGARGATRIETAPLERPGLYRVLLGGRLRGSFAVNPDPRESDLASLEEPALVAGFPAGRASVLRAGADLARRVREARFGRELWAEFALLALALLVAESIIGRWGMPPSWKPRRAG